MAEDSSYLAQGQQSRSGEARESELRVLENFASKSWRELSLALTKFIDKQGVSLLSE
jgi:hypothetical protein